MEKREEAFKANLLKIEMYMRKSKFSEAIKLYHITRSLFNELPSELKLKYEQETIALFKELVLYITTNEAYYLAEHHGELRALGNHMQEILDLENDLKELPESDEILRYLKPKFEFCLNVYEYRTSGKDFDDKFKHVEQLVTEGKTKIALKEYAHLILAYNRYIRYEDEDKSKKIYNKVLELFNRIKTHKTIENLYDKPKFKPQKASLFNKVPYNSTRPYVTQPYVKVLSDNLKPFPQTAKPKLSLKDITPPIKKVPKLVISTENLQPHPLIEPLEVTGIKFVQPEPEMDPMQKLKEHIRNDNVLEASDLLKRL